MMQENDSLLRPSRAVARTTTYVVRATLVSGLVNGAISYFTDALFLGIVSIGIFASAIALQLSLTIVCRSSHRSERYRRARFAFDRLLPVLGFSNLLVSLWNGKDLLDSDLGFLGALLLALALPNAVASVPVAMGCWIAQKVWQEEVYRDFRMQNPGRYWET